MIKSIRFISILLLFAITTVGCKKVNIVTQKTRYGEASVNVVNMYDYVTVKQLLAESAAPQLMPLADFIKTRDDIFYLQTTLRKDVEEDFNN